MSMKESLLLFFAIILLNYMKNECEAIQCYSCSDCATSTKINWKTISTVNINDQCINATVSTSENEGGRKIIYRGASSHCKSYSSKHSSISCCNVDFCNE